MDTRLGKITVSKAGGTAGRGAKTYKLSLPSAWVNAMDLAGNDNQVLLSFDGESVTLRPRQDMQQYRSSRLAKGHELLEIRYYNGDALCTLICVDRTARDLLAENYTDLYIKTAFGKKEFPDWADLEVFLEERCIPRQRDRLNAYLSALGLGEYDPLAIIEKTKGRMAEDDQWLEVNRIR